MSEITASELIVWASPAAFGLAVYLAHDAYTSIKDDIKELKDSQRKTRDEVSEVKRITDTQSLYLKDVGDSVKAQNPVIRGIDARLIDTRELRGKISEVENKLTVQEENHGKIILVLKKVIEILRPKPPQGPPRGPP